MSLDKVLPVDSISKDWLTHLQGEFSEPYMQELIQFLEEEKRQNKTIFPEFEDIFSAFSITPLKKVKVVIFGQDPYHGQGQAHGLAFSVKPGVKIPPSLRNMYKELETDIGFETPDHGHLIKWAEQGVLLLNAVLTVEEAKAGSHQKKGWEKFTDKVVQTLNDECEDLIFILWGSHAHKKGKNIDTDKHHIIKGPHPSPLSAYRGFFGCKHFSQTNEYLKSKGAKPIDWQLNIC